MSRLTDLIAQAKAKDAALGQELEREFKVLSSRRAFGLNFERHRPESVELPGRPVRKGDKVRILPSRGSNAKGDQRLWRVLRVETINGVRTSHLAPTQDQAETDRKQVATEDLIVVAEFKDYIYPGLVSTGKVERGGDKPFHTVINGENFHVLEALTFTHRGKIDVIYIDPPYNTGAKDWKYNNDYVGEEDLYRHSKWLAMMERRLSVAKQLLNPQSSVLRGTRCARPAFMRSPGTSQTPFSKSISPRVAFNTSEVLAAVRIRNRRAREASPSSSRKRAISVGTSP